MWLRRWDDFGRWRMACWLPSQEACWRRACVRVPPDAKLCAAATRERSVARGVLQAPHQGGGDGDNGDAVNVMRCFDKFGGDGAGGGGI